MDSSLLNLVSSISFLFLAPLITLKVIFQAYGSGRLLIWSRRLNPILFILSGVFLASIAMRIMVISQESALSEQNIIVTSTVAVTELADLPIETEISSPQLVFTSTVITVQTASATATMTASPTVTQTASPTATQTASATATMTASPTMTQTATPTASVMATETASPTASANPTESMPALADVLAGLLPGTPNQFDCVTYKENYEILQGALERGDPTYLPAERLFSSADSAVRLIYLSCLEAGALRIRQIDPGLYSDLRFEVRLILAN